MPDQKTVMDVGALALKLAGNPKTRGTFLRQVAAIDPTYRLPADVQLADLKNEIRRDKENDKIHRAAEVSAARENQQRAKLLEHGRYSEDQVKEIETVMNKYGLRDYEAGSKLYAADTAPARPSNRDRPRHGQIWEFPDLPGLLQNPEKAANDAAYAVLDEMRAGR